MNHTETHEIAAALAKAQSEIGFAKKSSTNPHFKSKYADLSEVWDAWQKVGPKNGLAVTQTTDFDESGLILETTLLHTSGQRISGRARMKPVKDDPQGWGSAITYFRRYCLAAMVGIAPDDDDGNAASGRDAPETQAVKKNGKKEESNGVYMWTHGDGSKEQFTALAFVNGLETRPDLWPANEHVARAVYQDNPALRNRLKAISDNHKQKAA